MGTKFYSKALEWEYWGMPAVGLRIETYDKRSKAIQTIMSQVQQVKADIIYSAFLRASIFARCSSITGRYLPANALMPLSSELTAFLNSFTSRS